MLEKFLNLFKTRKEGQLDPEVEKELGNLQGKLEYAGDFCQRSVSESMRKKEHPEGSERCLSCSGSGLLKKDIRLLYPCRDCFGEGSVYWVDRCLTASRIKDYEIKSQGQICSNIHTLMYELKQEAIKIGLVALIEIKPIEPEKIELRKGDLDSMNWFGRNKRDGKDS